MLLRRRLSEKRTARRRRKRLPIVQGWTCKRPSGRGRGQIGKPSPRPHSRYGLESLGRGQSAASPGLSRTRRAPPGPWPCGRGTRPGAGCSCEGAAGAALLVVIPMGIVAFPTGIHPIPKGIVAFPRGISAIPAGIAAFPTGILIFPAGIVAFPRGILIFPAGIFTFPAGIVAFPMRILTFPMEICNSPSWVAPPRML